MAIENIPFDREAERPLAIALTTTTTHVITTITTSAGRVLSRNGDWEPGIWKDITPVIIRTPIP